MKITVANKIDKAFKRASQYFIIKADSKTPNRDLVHIKFFLLEDRKLLKIDKNNVMQSP